jgi:hypothetical protein
LPNIGNYNYQQGGVSLDEYITDTIAPMLYYKFNEASGDLINYGSETGADGVVSGATQGETGQLGAGEAYSFDGVDDVVTIANANIPNVKALTTQRWAFLVNATTGEGGFGAFFAYGNSSAANHQLRFIVDQFFVRINCTTDAVAVSTSGDVADILSNWAWVFMDYDHDSSRVIRLFKGVGGTLTELVKTTNTASTGSVGGQTTVALNIGNRADLAFTFGGLFDVVIADSGLWTADDMQQLIDLSGV